MKRPRTFEEAFTRAAKLFLVSGAVVLIWSAALYFVRQSDISSYGARSPADLAALLFGASALALFLFSLIISLIAVFGWQAIILAARDAALDAVKTMNDPLLVELRGRQLAFQGLMLGEFSIDPEDLTPRDRGKLAEAIGYCQQAYDQLKGLGGPIEYMALNNLVYYSSIAGERSRSNFLLSSARRLMEVGQEHNQLNLLLTACRVILQYGTDRDEGRRAYEVLTEVARSRAASEKEKREAQLYLASIPEP
jgi:hypothetical protein